MLTCLGPTTVLCSKPKPDRNSDDCECTEADPHPSTTWGRGRFLHICFLHGFTLHGRLVPTACSRAMRAAYASSRISVYPVSISMERRCSAMTSNNVVRPYL